MRSVGVRAKVEKAAIALFAAKGVEGVSIGEIAAAAGVSQGALYRHYRGKEDLAATLFSTAYLRTGAELAEIRGRQPGFDARVGAMVAHFCSLYDRDPALFRFMLIAQHNLLPQVRPGQRTPVEEVAETVGDAVRAGEIAPVDPLAAAAAIMGIVLQTAIFHIYGRLRGSLSARAPDVARAAIAAVAALGQVTE
ncbi:MAG TPA: TetR/AcrR family transcriptional regulator [Stellaceae bacterium]|nr:TetR/AcrR family transcriptional regulator [Stellaceae bacterium]